MNNHDFNHQNLSITRRKFLGLIGAGTAATLFTSPAWAAFELPPDELERWRNSLFKPASPRLYLSSKHTDARLHLGGIGTGNFEIGADGQLTTWQLFNTLRDGYVPFYFGVKSGETAKLLQTASGPDWPRIKQIEMMGEYPFCTLRFKDDDLPVQLELEAFTPMEPLNTKLSSMPLAVFRFRVHNLTSDPQTVSLAAMLANPVGYAAIGKIQGNSHPSLGFNVNETFTENGASGLLLSAQSGNDPVLDKPVSLYLLKDLFVIPPDPGINNKNYASINPDDLNIPPLDRPENLRVEVIRANAFASGNFSNATQSVIWLEDAPANLSGEMLSEMQRAVKAGATMVFSGNQMPLLKNYATVTAVKSSSETAMRQDIVFEDFENGYNKWTIEGNAFGQEPEHGTLPGQQPVSGFLEKGLVNSFVGGDDTTGKLASQTFTVERNFIRFLVGGGHFKTTQIRLIINGKIVLASSGEDNEHLKSAIWDVTKFAGQTAHVEIVDNQKGGWGHINIDQIVFTDWPADPIVVQLLEDLLPIRFSGIETLPEQSNELARVDFQNQSLQSGAQQSVAKNGLEQFVRPIGDGKVILLAGRLLDSARTGSAWERQNTYSALCSFVGANYTMTTGQSTKEPGFGTLALATLAKDTTALTGFDDWNDAWKQFQAQGRFQPLESVQPNSPTPQGQTTNCALASTVTVPAGGTAEVPFFFTWHYPNKYNRPGDWMGCYYSTQWPEARAVMREATANYPNLCQKSESFRDTFYDSTLPYWLLDCATANSGIMRHIGVVFRIANGDIYGWEGSNGSCEPTCTHVWGYEQSLAHLFPDLEKEMRRIDYTHQQSSDGGIYNRTDVPSPPHPTYQEPFTDGHASCILKAYREALNSPDESFFIEYWPRVKLAVEYLINRDAKAANGKPIGILQDDQWNTYDEALHGVTTFISGYYLAALRAGEEWACRMNDTATADRYHKIFESGQKKLIELCWNGEYFQQHLPDYLSRPGEVGPGCMSDQLIGQWWAHQLGLGYIFPKDMVVTSLQSIFKYNWKSDLTEWKQKPRVYAGAYDKGLIICTWPKGGRPNSVMNYSDEVWTGIEYQVAAHMIYEGMTEQGFSMVKGARDRYDGVPRPPVGRNPWCEIECGGHYSRAMSSWSLLLALSGYEYDGPRAILRFNPRHEPENFRCFFSGPNGWGNFTQKTNDKKQYVSIVVKSGSLDINVLHLKIAGSKKPSKITALVGGHAHSLKFQVIDGFAEIQFKKGKLLLNAKETLEIAIA